MNDFDSFGDLDDLGDLENLDCDWDNDPPLPDRQNSANSSSSDKQRRELQQQQQHEQEQQQQMLIQQQQQLQAQQQQQQVQQQMLQAQQMQQQQGSMGNNNMNGFNQNGMGMTMNQDGMNNNMNQAQYQQDQCQQQGGYNQQQQVFNNSQDQQLQLQQGGGVQQVFSSNQVTPGNSLDNTQFRIDPQAITSNSGNAHNMYNETSQIRLDREREGRCADCGAQTHELKFDPSGSGNSIKAPLSVPGEVHRGRCVLCHPLPPGGGGGASSLSQGREGRSSSGRGRRRISFEAGLPPDPSQLGITNGHSGRANRRASFEELPPNPQLFGRQGSSRRSSNGHGGEEPGQLEEHFMNNTRPTSGFGHQNSSSSVYSTSSQQSSRSIYSHQSAPAVPVWQKPNQIKSPSPFPQQDMPQDQQQGFDYQKHQQQLQKQQIMQQQQQQQQLQYPGDDGSVYSQQSHQSHHSIYSQGQASQTANSYHSYNQQINSPQINPSNIDTQFNRSGSGTSNGNNLTNTNDFASGAAAEVVYRQLSEETIDFEKCLQAMRQFPGHAGIQEKACAILWNQTCNTDVCNAISSMNMGGNVTGISILLEAMRNHPHNPTLQHTACEAIRNLCIHTMNLQYLANAGGVPLLVEMMQLHVDNAEIQRVGCTALACVCEGGMEHKISVAESGGILAVMKAVEIHPENDVVLRAAYQALRMMGYNPGAKSS